jgi:hypothetical protein
MFSRPRNIPSRIRHDDTNLPARLTSDSVLPLEARARLRRISCRDLHTYSYFQEEKHETYPSLLHRGWHSLVRSRGVNIALRVTLLRFLLPYILIPSTLHSSTLRAWKALGPKRHKNFRFSFLVRSRQRAIVRSAYKSAYVFARYAIVVHVVRLSYYRIN